MQPFVVSAGGKSKEEAAFSLGHRAIVRAHVVEPGWVLHSKTR